MLQYSIDQLISSNKGIKNQIRNIKNELKKEKITTQIAISKLDFLLMCCKCFDGNFESKLTHLTQFRFIFFMLLKKK